MQFSLDLPDELAARLQQYAQELRQTPQEVITELVEHGLPTSAQPHPPVNLDPLEGFYGAFEAIAPDVVERHDYYIGREALDPHDDK